MIWSFNPNFLARHCKDIDAEDIKHIQSNDKCEGNNALLRKLITDYDHFINDAISADGRGHFLSGYDGDEHESGNYYIYRTN